MPHVKVNTLHGSTPEFLEKLHDIASLEIRKLRIRTLILSFSGKPVREIANELMMDKETVYRYIHNWNSVGLQSLSLIEFRQNQDGEVFKTIKHVLPNSLPSDYNLKGKMWTIEKTRVFINKKYNTNYNFYKIRRMLCEMGGIKALIAR